MARRRFLIIIGAAKAGTSTLSAWLGARPDMVLCREKEPRFFTDFAEHVWTGPGADEFQGSLIADETAYLDAFEGAGEGDWHIDASTDYLWHPEACPRIAAWSRDHEVRLICILRDPVDRAFSQYQHTVRDHMEPDTLATALDAEADRRAAHWQPVFYHQRRSEYADDVARYVETFGDDLLVLDFSELADPGTCLARITDFLGVAQEETAAPGGMARQNASHSYRNRWLAKLIWETSFSGTLKRIVPKPLRDAVKRTLMGWLRKEDSSASPAEIDLLLARLAPEYARCAALPRIRMDRWAHAAAALAHTPASIPASPGANESS